MKKHDSFHAGDDRPLRIWIRNGQLLAKSHHVLTKAHHLGFCKFALTILPSNLLYIHSCDAHEALEGGQEGVKYHQDIRHVEYMMYYVLHAVTEEAE